MAQNQPSLESTFGPGARHHYWGLPQGLQDDQQPADMHSLEMHQPNASIRPGQFETLTRSGAAFRPMETSSRNASSMPGAVTGAPAEEAAVPVEASFQQSIAATERSVLASHEESAYQKNTKQSSIQSYPPQEASLAEQLLQGHQPPTALMQFGSSTNRPLPSFNQTSNARASSGAHNILLQQLSQYTVPLSYREEADRYRPPPMAANVIQTLLDPKIKNKKECIQRICGGQKERQPGLLLASRPHPKSQAVPKRVHLAKRSAYADQPQQRTLRHFLRSQGNRAWRRGEPGAWNPRRSQADSGGRESQAVGSAPSSGLRSYARNSLASTLQPAEYPINLSVGNSPTAGGKPASKTKAPQQLESLGGAVGGLGEDFYSGPSTFAPMRIVYNPQALPRTTRGKKRSTLTPGGARYDSMGGGGPEDFQGATDPVSFTNEAVAGIWTGTSEVASGQRPRGKKANGGAYSFPEEEQSLLLSNGSQHEDALPDTQCTPYAQNENESGQTPLEEMAAIEKHVAGLAAHAPASPGKRSERAGVRRKRHMSVHRVQGPASQLESVNSNSKADGATVRMPSGEGSSRPAREMLEAQSTRSNQESGGAAPGGLPKLQVGTKRPSLGAPEAGQALEQSPADETGKKSLKKGRRSPRRECTKQPKQASHSPRELREQAPKWPKQYQPMKNTVFSFSPVPPLDGAPEANRQQHGACGSNLRRRSPRGSGDASPSPRSRTQRYHPHLRPAKAQKGPSSQRRPSPANVEGVLYNTGNFGPTAAAVPTRGNAGARGPEPGPTQRNSAGFSMGNVPTLPAGWPQSRDTESSWRDFHDQSTSPAHFEPLSKSRASAGREHTRQVPSTAEAGARRNHIVLQQASIPGTRISQEVDSAARGHGVTFIRMQGCQLTGGAARGGPSPDYSEMVNPSRRASRGSRARPNGYSTLPPQRPNGDLSGLPLAGNRIRQAAMKDGVSREVRALPHGQDSARSKEDETIRRASQHSGTDFGLTSEGFMSHGDTSPEGGLQKMLLPQYKNTHESSEGRTESQIVGPSKVVQKQAAKVAKNRPKTQERKQRVPPAQLNTRAIKLKECVKDDLKQPQPAGNAPGDLVQTRQYTALHVEPLSPGYVQAEPGSPAAFSPIRTQGQTLLLGAATDEDGQSSIYGSARHAGGELGTLRLRSGTLDKKSLLRDETRSDSPLQAIIQPELIMKQVGTRTKEKTPNKPKEDPNSNDTVNSGEEGALNTVVDRYRIRQEHRKTRLPVSFLKQQMSYNQSIESQRAQVVQNAVSGQTGHRKSRSPTTQAPLSGEFDFASFHQYEQLEEAGQFFHLPQHQIIMDEDGNLTKDNSVTGRELVKKSKRSNGLDPNAILIQQQAGSFRKSKRGSQGQVSERSDELPLDIIRYSKKAIPPPVAVTPFIDSIESENDEGKVTITVKRKKQQQPRIALKNLLATQNERAMDFKKVNMQKRILTEESRKACGDEDKLFNERQKMAQNRFHVERQSCHICKEKIERVFNQVEKVISSTNTTNSPGARKIQLQKCDLEERAYAMRHSSKHGPTHIYSPTMSDAEREAQDVVQASAQIAQQRIDLPTEMSDN